VRSTSGRPEHETTGHHEEDVDRPAPAPLPRFDQAVAERRQTGARQEHADVVDPGAPGAARFGHEQGHRDQRDRDHRHVDEEHRPPPEVGEKPAAEDRPDREGDHRHAHHDGDRPLALLLGEQHGDHRDRQGQDERGAEPEQGAGRDELPGRPGVGAGQRGEAEDDEGDDQEPLAAVAVAEQPAGQQHGREHEAVGHDEPLQHAAVCDAQRDRQGGQRQIEDREVETDDETAQREGAERPPAAAAGGHDGCIHDRDDLSVVTVY